MCLFILLIPIKGMAQTSSTDDKPVLFPKLFGLNKSISVGFIGGTTDHFNYGAFGFNASVYGVYADIMVGPRSNAGDMNINVDDADLDVQLHRSLFAFHIGYQIPFHKYQDGSIRLIPVVGLARTSVSSESKTDTGISTSNYYAKATDTNFDYGGVLVFQNRDKHIGYYNFSIGYTRYTAWVGLGIDIRIGKQK